MMTEKCKLACSPDSNVQEHYVHATQHTEQAVKIRAARVFVCSEVRTH